MHTETLIIAAVVVSLAINLGMAIVFWTRRTYPGFGYWLVGGVCRTAGAVLFLLPRDEFPPWLTIVLPNYLLVLEALLYIRGTLTFRGRSVRIGAEIGVSLSFIALFVYFAYITPNVNARIVVISFYGAALSLWMIRVLLDRRRPAYFGSSDLLQAGVWGGLAAVSIVRAVSAWAYAPPITDLIAPAVSALQSPVILFTMVAALMIALSQIMMNAQRLEHAYRRTQSQLEQDIVQRKQAETALRRSLDAVGRHADQMTALNRMNDQLMACDAPEETYPVIARNGEALFAPGYGGLLIARDDSSALDVAACWGDCSRLRSCSNVKGCRALVQASGVADHDRKDAPGCRHSDGSPDAAYLCIPLTVDGRTLGMLHLGADPQQPIEVFHDLGLLAKTVGESIKLTLSNLRLRGALREQAIRDPLTGLFNRRYLDETLPREWLQCRRNGEALSVAVMDLDHFKRFNDSYGHEAGNVVLRAVGELLRGFVRASDIACRYGGEELTLILPGAELIDAKARLELLRRAVTRLSLFHRGRLLPSVTLSIGVAAAEPDDAGPGALLGRADEAMYRAKEQGRNRVVAAES
jgi:diguanylate cyclase (GGDEF)-like protein